MQRVLLTGATGFIGYHMTRRLREAACDEIRCLVRAGSETRFIDSCDVRYYEGDLRDRESLARAMEGCDTVFHLAGRVRARNVDEFLQANATGTENLAAIAAGRDDPPVFVYVSSLAVAGPALDGFPKQESDPPCPISDYGRSKWEAERRLSEFARSLPCSIVRPGIVFGEADRMNLELFKMVRKFGFCPIPGWRDRVYCWIHATDLSELLLRVATSGERVGRSDDLGGGIYFASTDDGMALSEVGRRIGRSLGLRRTPALCCPPAAVWTVSTFYELLKRTTGGDQPYDWAKASESLNHWRCSPEKAERQLGFRPLASFSERLAQTTEWYRRSAWL